MAASPASSVCDELQTPAKSGDSEDEKESGICRLSCLVSSCLCTSSSCPLAQCSKTATQPFLRSSLFSNVPPTIRFYVKGAHVTKPSKRIRSRLLWCHNSLLPIVMRQCLSTSHFTVVDENSAWLGYWGRHLKSSQYRSILPFQKVNHFPGAFHIGRKDRLWQHIQEMMVIWGEEEYNIMPTTYILPRDAKKLKAYLNTISAGYIILKPPASARGTGISITNKYRHVPTKTPLIAQHYISHPLIINDAKFDLRLYVYLTSLSPLRIYVFNDGLVRFASVPYSSSPSSMTNKFMHLTNYSINKLAQAEGQRDTPVPKWRISEFWHYVKDYMDVGVVQQRICDVIIKAVLACENSIRAHQKKHSSYTFTSHELYGMDILLDDTLKPWLLEVNISPSLHSGTPLDVSVKAPLAKDVLNLCGVQLPPDVAGKKPSAETIDYSVKPFEGNKTSTELEKESYHVDYYLQHRHINPSILDNLTGSDVRTLIDFEDELTRRGGFQLIFPTVENLGYMKYFNDPIYSNLLLMQWQIEQGKGEDRSAGRQHLEEICCRHGHRSLAKIPKHIINEVER
ncbi:hypothetical protein AB6A40_007373 [Gnathostoma spinigerum]|uniref:Tubulin polyglutamylase TTLL4 n=1 Tax=Gnathostoma spinigerum TaxID=75299 RepID=A0ABD6ER62_9BILA